jgi:chromosome partitioning protein
MGMLESMDWDFLQNFLGHYGKIIGTGVGVIVAMISLAVAIFRYRLANTIERILGKSAHKVQKDLEFLEKGKAALEQEKLALEYDRTQIRLRQQRLDNVRKAFIGKEHDLWCLHAANNLEAHDRRIKRQRQQPIVTIANFKGGVGKTTLTANLAAHFSAIGKRVLLVDVDYQGSLSNMLLSADGVEEVSAKISNVLEPGATFATTSQAIRPFSNILQGSSIITSKYQFASLENRVMIEYLLQDDQDDGRFRLANLLLSDDMSGRFDLVLIDAPPRLTAGTVNAFCASTHLLVPTIYDLLSAEAVGTFLNGAEVLKHSLNHGIDLLGVVGMLTYQQGRLSVREENAKRAAMRQVATAWSANHYFFERHIPRKAYITEAAGQDLAYFRDETVKEWFDALGTEIGNRLGLRHQPLLPTDPRTTPNALLPLRRHHPRDEPGTLAAHADAH